jgi:hypothetical protein
LSQSLERALASEPLDLDQVRSILAEAERVQPDLGDSSHLAHRLEQTLIRLGQALIETPRDLTVLRHLAVGIKISQLMPFPVDLHKLQTAVFMAGRTVADDFLFLKGLSSDERWAKAWQREYHEIAGALRLSPLRTDS